MFSLAKIADKNFVIGYVLPVLIAMLSIAFLFRDFGVVEKIFPSLLEQKSFTELTIAVISVWVLAILLMALNNFIIRFLEGYIRPFKDKDFWFSSCRKQFRQRRDELTELYKNAESGCAKSRQKYIQESIDFKKDFPFEERLVLPTRFGNVLRAFETYSLSVYEIDAIPGWTRLSGIIPSSYSSLIDSARAEVNFFANIWFSALIIAVSAAARTVYDIHVAYRWDDWSQIQVEHIGIMALGIAAMWLAYRTAIPLAKAWGEYVKGAFDLYLPDLAKQMGYQLPESAAERRAFWGAITAQSLAWEPVDPAKWVRAESGHIKEEAKQAPSAGDDDLGDESDD